MKDSKPRVVIVQKSLPHYRRRFFELLYERLQHDGVELLLLYGNPGSSDTSRGDLVDIPWAIRLNNRIIHFGRKETYWQPCLGHLRQGDLVIVEQASRLLVNYVLFAQQALGLNKVAFWGHGRNFQLSSTNAGSEIVKRWISRLPHWWFPYTELSAEIVRSLEYPVDRITTVQNAIDTRQLISAFEAVSPDMVAETRRELGLNGENVAMFCGGMYREKRLRFLLEACQIIRREVQDFEIIFIGAGPDQGMVEGAAQAHKWVHYVGPKFDEEKARYFRTSKLYLMPGAVGLGVLDSFALETPLVTTQKDDHGPEIQYLAHNENGISAENDIHLYAREVVTLLRDEERRMRLIRGCREAARRYTVEVMVDNFAHGIMQALARPSRKL